MSNKYLFCIESIQKSLNNVINILGKTQTWAAESGKTDQEILAAKLAPDMLPFVNQITILCDNAKGLAARLSGTEIPVHADTQTTIAELIERVKMTHEFINTIGAQEYTDAHQKQIVLPYIPGKYQTAEDFARDFAMPNFYFHTVTAYAILRNLGMPLSKMDYIGSLILNDL